MAGSGFNQRLNAWTLASVRRGNRKARERVYRMLADPAWNLALRLTGSEANASDAVQEAFARMFERVTQYRGEAPFGMWFRRILINEVCDQMRRQGKLRPLDDAPDPIQAPPDTRWLDLEKALEALSPDDRLVVWLYDVEGMSHREIAETTGKSEPWSKSRLSRARSRLRALVRSPVECAGSSGAGS